MASPEEIAAFRTMMIACAQARGMRIGIAASDSGEGWVFAAPSKRLVVDTETDMRSPRILRGATGFFDMDHNAPASWPPAFSQWNRARLLQPVAAKVMEPSAAIEITKPTDCAEGRVIEVQAILIECARKIAEVYKDMPTNEQNSFLFMHTNGESGLRTSTLHENYNSALGRFRAINDGLSDKQIANAVITYLNAPKSMRRDLDVMHRTMAEAMVAETIVTVDYAQRDKRREHRLEYRHNRNAILPHHRRP